MTETPFTAPAQPGPDANGPGPDANGSVPPPLSTPARPALRRSRDDRVVAGVCGGVGRTLGIDPLLVRVLVLASAVFGGAGLVAYLVGWLMIPDDGTETSEARRVYDDVVNRTGSTTPRS